MEGETSIVPEPTPHDLNRQLRNIYFAVPPHQKVEAPLGSPEAWEELKKLALTSKRMMGSEYATREILKRNLSGLLERSETTPSFQSYMVTLFDSLYKHGRYVNQGQTKVPGSMPIQESEFIKALDIFTPGSPGVFDPDKAKFIEHSLYSFAEERLETLEGTKAGIVREGRERYASETEHLQELLPTWLAEFAKRHFDKDETGE